MKKILVPTDFSDCAAFAEKTAIALSKVLSGELKFYHFMGLPIQWIESDELRNKLYPDIALQIDEIKEALETRVKHAEKAGIQASYLIGHNDTADHILSQVQDHDINLVVMGSHGDKGIKDYFLGSNSQKIIRNSKVPVIIVKQAWKEIHVEDILFVSNFEDEMFKSFEEVLVFAELLNAKISLLYVNTPAYFNESWLIRQKMESFVALAANRLNRADIIDTFHFVEGVERYCSENHEGMVAIATHNQKSLSNMFRGSVAEKLINHLQVPVITFPIGEYTSRGLLKRDTLEFHH